MDAEDSITSAKERIGDYELIALIGDGAQGRVYKARCVADSGPVAKDEIVAVKVLRIVGDDDKLREKFQQQADILRRLSHTNIVRYRDCFAWHAGEWDEAQCLVMEFLEGETLQERLKKAGAGLPWAQVEELFEQCLAGLIHARERGITHRDIKPSNIFITSGGQAKVIDFDIARRDEGGQMSTAGWKGTFDYMAPDFIALNGFRGDEVSDVFSLGVCFYQALCGSLPYEPLGENAHIGYLNRWKDNAAPAPSYRPGVFRVLGNAKAVVARCLSARREQRYPAFTALLEDFRKIRYRRIRHKNKDEYELLAVLGRGGFGEVFKARRVSDGELVAVKYLFAEKQSERFIKEAKILQQYPHPNLVKYVDFMSVDATAGEKQYFLILEYLEGMPGWTLRTRLKNEGRLDPGEALPLFCGYLSALQFLHTHSRPIIHRDIKPGNLYAPVGQPAKGKIFDLGVARDVAGTVTVGGVPGTLDYMAPEFAEAGGDRGSPQSDLYALGLCLYESLEGRPVYDRLPTDMNSAWLAFQQRLRTPPELTFDSDAFRQYPRLKSLIAKAIAVRPADRFRSAEQMRFLMEAILSGQGGAVDEEDPAATIATLHTFESEGELAPEPGATAGTRPLDGGAGGTLPAAMDLIAAGRAEVNRRRQRRRLAMAAGIAAGVMVAIGLVSWLVTSLNHAARTRGSKAREDWVAEMERTGEDLRRNAPPTADRVKTLARTLDRAVRAGDQYPELAERIDEFRRQLRKLGAAQPAEFVRAFDAAIAAGDGAAAAKIVRDWEALEDSFDILAVTPERHAERREAMRKTLQRHGVEAEVTALRKGIPAVLRGDADLKAANTAAENLQALERKPWPGYDPAEKKKTLDAIGADLAARAGEWVARQRDAALVKFRAGQDGEAEREVLARFAKDVPALARLAEAAHSDALAGVEAARRERLAAGVAGRLLDRVANARDAARVDEAAREYLDIQSAPETRLPSEQAKPVEEALTAKYKFLAEESAQAARQAFGADRGADGETQLKRLGDLLEGMSDRFGKAALAGLKREVEAARAGMVQRIAQAAAAREKEARDAGAALTDVRARIQKGDLRQCADAVTVLNSLGATAKADAGLLARRETIANELAALVAATLERIEPLDERPQRIQAADALLTTAGADEVFGGRAAGLREKLAQAKIAPRKQEAPPVATPGPTAVTPAATPPAPVAPAASPPAVSVPAGKALLNIVVSPRGGTLTVDENTVAPGAIEVTANENHRVRVEFPGYKPYEQYYRVKAGESRRIDILLEKAQKKSFFSM
jgi:serine/threonine protein kinase